MRWIDMPVMIRSTAKRTKDERYKRTITPKMNVGFKSAINIVNRKTPFATLYGSFAVPEAASLLPSVNTFGGLL
jgi:hypothetical protein